METIWYVSYADGKQFFTYEERIANMARLAGAIILENPRDSSGNILTGDPTQTITSTIDENGNITYSVIVHPDVESAVLNAGVPPPIPNGPTEVELLEVRVNSIEIITEDLITRINDFETINTDLIDRVNNLETINADLTGRLYDLEQWALTLTRP